MQLQNIFQHIHRYGRHCLHCGGYFTKPSLFCASCEEILWQRHIKRQIGHIDEVPVFVLFHWEPDQDRQISKLLKTMKQGRLKDAFKYYAQEFLLRESPHIPSNSLLLSCPGKRPDHASVLADQFSAILGIDHEDLLESVEEKKGPQKAKSKTERMKRRFSCRRTLADKHVIFIDDIVTTGATLRAAKQAIGPCQSFQVWALAQRVVSLRPPC